MAASGLKAKLNEWFRHYALAETLGTLIALSFAWFTYSRTHSYIAAAGAGFVGEGIGFYGYFISSELLSHGLRTKGLPLGRRLWQVITRSSTNLLVEFAPAEILDNFLIRPFAMFLAPQYIKPYPLGFIAGKLGADIIFYAFAIVGYEARQHWLSDRKTDRD